MVVVDTMGAADVVVVNKTGAAGVVVVVATGGFLLRLLKEN